MVMQDPLDAAIDAALGGGGGGGFDPQFRDLGGGYGQDIRTGGYFAQNSDGSKRLVGSEEIQAYQAQEASRPRVSVSSSTSQSLADPRELELAYAKLDEDRRALDMQDAREKLNLQFLRDKFAVETQENNARGARETQALMEQITSRIETNGLKRQQMQMEQQQFGQQLALQRQSQQLAERRQGFDEFSFGQQQENQRLEQRRALANDIASYARNPGDVGAQAAFLQAQGTGSPISTAIGQGQDARTADSLSPLVGMLEIQDRLNQPQAQFNPQQGSASGFLNNAAQQAPPSPYKPGGGVDQGLIDEYNAWQQNGGPGGSVPMVAAAKGFNGFVDEPTLFLAGEGTSPEAVNIQPAQTSGQAQRLSRAQEFLNNAAQMAMQKTGFSSVPTPVQLSTPGMNPYLQEVGAGIAGTARGIDPRLFLSEAQGLAPVGLSGAPMRRTR